MTTKRGFTIIELLIVIVIMGLLTSIATASFLSAQRSARDNARKTQVQSIATAVETFYATKRVFPGKEKDVTASAVTIAKCETPIGGTDPAYKYYIYYFTPDQDCQTANPLRFSPAGTWIPGLGEYLNPFPIDNRMKSLTFTDPLQNPAGSPTIVYRHLENGYAVYTPLEKPDSEPVNANSLTTTAPKLPVTTVSATNLFIVRK